MARIRTIKPEFWQSATLARLDPVVVLTFVGLLNHLDDSGRCKDRPALVKAAVHPLRENITSADVATHLASLIEAGALAVIGSHPQHSTLVLADPHLAPRHVEILRQPDGFYARDLGTQTGTSCRGQRLGPQPFKLQNGDVLMLGQNIALLFEAAP